MLAEGRFSLRLFGAFSLIAVAFVASSVYANWLSVAIEGDAHVLTANALPSVEHLTAACDALRDLEASTDDYADLGPDGRPAARAHIKAMWSVVDTELAKYLDLPSFPGERDLYREVPESLRGLDSAMDRLFADTESGDRERARDTADRVVRAKANLSARLLRQLVGFNATQAAESSKRIQATRRKVVLVAALLNASTLLFTAAIAVWIWRIFRSYSRLQHEHADLVERRAAELEIFGRRVAHDLLSPLSSLTFCLTAFKPASETDPKLASALTRARQCVVRAQGLVDNVFDFARSGGAPSEDASASVADVIDQVVEEARSVEPSERPEIHVGPVPECAVRCSRGVLASILGNLVRNSIKFMRDSEQRRIAVRVTESGDQVRFEVEDTGPGIPPGLEEAIFQPYVRGEGVTQPGLGLGLATVRRFCEAHGGSVGVRPSEGHGSVFHFTLPRAAHLGPWGGRGPEPPRPSGEGGRGGGSGRERSSIAARPRSSRLD